MDSPWFIIDSSTSVISLVLVLTCIPINLGLRKLPVSRAWFCIVFSLLSGFIGNIIRIRNRVLLGGPGNVPYPGGSDMFFLLSYLLFGLALLLILRDIADKMLLRRPTKELATLVIVVLASLTLGYALHGSGHFKDLVFDTLYLLLPLVNATLALFVVEFNRGRRASYVWFYFAAANIAWAFTKTLWAVSMVIGFVGQQIIPNFIHMLGYVFCWLAIYEQVYLVWLKRT